MPWFGTNNGCYFLVVSALPHRITAWSVADRDFKQNHHDIITWQNDFLVDGIPLFAEEAGMTAIASDRAAAQLSADAPSDA